MNRFEVAVVGGGIAGLAAAYELACRGVPFQLFEASDRLGGLIRTERVDGFIIEAGADSMLAQKRAALDLCSELGLDAHLISTKPPRTAFVLHRGRLHRLPSPSIFGIPATWSGLAGLDLLSPLGRARLALEPLVPRRAMADESIGSFFRRRFGHQAAERLAQPLLGGIHAGDIDTLSLRALVPRLADAEAHGSVLGWVRNATRTPDPGGAFRSLTGGMGELVDAIRERLPADAVQLNAPIESIAPAAPGFRLTTSRGPVDCRAVIVAAPAHAAARMLAALEPRAAERCREVRYVSTVSVALAFPQGAIGEPLHGTGFVAARAERVESRITACTWVSSKFDGRAPAGSVLLRAFLGGAHDPAAVDLPDEELIAIATRDVTRVLRISGSPTVVRIYRWRNAGAQHEVGQAARVAEIERLLAAHPGIVLAGSGFRTVGIPDGVADGRAAAAKATAFVRL